MTRYFYTDQLAAAWMAKQFGMRFQAIYENVLDNSDYESAEEVLDYGGGVHLSIHPDFLHLLEPRVGDLVEYRVLNCWYVGKPPVCTAVLTKTEGKPAHWPPFHPPLNAIDKIIQRDGKPFFWPEKESL